MKETNNPLFDAHHPDRDFISKNCKHYYCSVLSIVSFLPSANTISHPFSHSHDEYEFLIPYGPIPMIFNRNSVHFAEPGFIYPVQSGNDHGSKFRITQVAHDDITVSKSFMDIILAKKGYSDRPLDHHFPITPEINSYITYFKAEAKKANPDEDKLLNLAALICRECVERIFSTKASTQPHVPQYQKGIHPIASYMHQNYALDLTIDEMADICNMSKNYFISSFKKSIGETPYHYLNKIRISNAKLFLENTTMSIQEISAQCGFQKPNSFASTFKASTGMTPSEYRKKHQES